MKWNKEIETELEKLNVDFVYFVDISHLSSQQNHGFTNAVLFGVKCSPEYLKRVSENPNYVPEMVERNYFDDDEHYAHEMEMYRISDILAGFIKETGYGSYSLSDENQITTSNFSDENKTYLPLKTLAVLAGLGWIGKNNLLVNKEFGCCQTWGGVLTDIPVNTKMQNPSTVLCGNCRICVDICQPNALKGKIWELGIERETIIDVDKCTTCLKCMVHCPWAQKYMNRELKNE